MWKTLVKLNYRLMWNQITSSGWRIAGTILATLYIGFLVTMGVIAAVSTPLADNLTNATVAISLIVAIFMLLWMLSTTAYFGTNPTLDPKNYNVFVAPTRRFAMATLAQNLLGPGTVIATVILCLPTITFFSNGRPIAGALVLVAFILAAAIASIMGRFIATAIAAAFSSGPILRAILSVIFIVAIVAAFIGYGQLMPLLVNPDNLDAVDQVMGILGSVVGVIQWIPGFALATAPVSVVAGNFVAYGYALVTGALVLAVVLYPWNKLIIRAMIRPDGVKASGGVIKGSGLIGVSSRLARYMSIPVATVAARELRYWRKDSRYIGQLVACMFLVGFGFFTAYMSAGEHGLFAWLFPYLGLAALGSTTAASAAMDSTAFWMHVASPITGLQDRLGRTVALSLFGIPATILVAAVYAFLPSAYALSVWASLALGLSAYLIHCGFSAVESLLLLYPMKPPGAPALQSNTQGFTVGAFLRTMLVGLLFFITVAIPAAIILLIPIRWLGSLIAIIVALAIFIGGHIWGGRIYDNRATIILSKITNWPGHKLRL